jgi:hypothetical protein
MSEYDWRKYWREFDKSSDKIKCVTPFRDGFIVEYTNSNNLGYCYLVDGNGKSVTQFLDVQLIPIPAPPAHWANSEDVAASGATYLLYRGLACFIHSANEDSIFVIDNDGDMLEISYLHCKSAKCGNHWAGPWRDCVVGKEGGE